MAVSLTFKRYLSLEFGSARSRSIHLKGQRPWGPCVQSLGTHHPTWTAIPCLPAVGLDQTAEKALNGHAEYSQKYLNLKRNTVTPVRSGLLGGKGSAPFSGDSGLELNSQGSCTDMQLVAAPSAPIPDTQARVRYHLSSHLRCS